MRSVGLWALVALLVFGCAVQRDPAVGPTEEELIGMALRKSDSDGSYAVVARETELRLLSRDEAAIRRLKASIVSRLRFDGDADPAVAGQLVDRFFLINQERSRHELKSALSDGYIVDDSGEFSKYFSKDGGGWERWYEERPDAKGFTRVSKPVKDPHSNLVLLYVGRQWHGLAGSGNIIGYRYEQGRLLEIFRVNVWVS